MDVEESTDNLRQAICDFWRFSVPGDPRSYQIEDVIQEDGYGRIRISYQGLEGGSIPAF